MQAFLDCAIIRFPAGFETGSGGAGVEGGVADGAGHRYHLDLAGVQQMSNIRARTPVDKLGHKWHYLSVVIEVFTTPMDTDGRFIVILKGEKSADLPVE
jgi:hypothetical protein